MIEHSLANAIQSLSALDPENCPVITATPTTSGTTFSAYMKPDHCHQMPSADACVVEIIRMRQDRERLEKLTALDLAKIAFCDKHFPNGIEAKANLIRSYPSKPTQDFPGEF